MRRLNLVAPIAALALVLAACEGGVLGETASPVTSPSPATSPESPDTSPDASPDGSPDASPDESPTGSPDASPGETRTIPFEPEGMAELAGEVTLTEMGSSTEVVVEFENVALPDNVGVARLLVGSCAEATQPVGELEIADGRIEGLIPLRLDSILDLPHAIAVYESDDPLADPIACADLIAEGEGGEDVEPSPSPTSS